VAARIALDLRIEPLRLASPFRISGYVFEAMPAVVATLRDGARFGRGEAAGVYYLGDAPEGMRATLEAQRDAIERGLSRDEARTLLPPGGARNALDCALWELESQRAGVPVWKLAGLEPPRPLLTTFTVGADAPDAMARAALGFATARAIKLKLTGEADLDAALAGDVLYPTAERLLQHCDAVLRLPGASAGADEDVRIARERGLPVYTDLAQVPRAG